MFTAPSACCTVFVEKSSILRYSPSLFVLVNCLKAVTAWLNSSIVSFSVFERGSSDAVAQKIAYLA